MEIFQGMAFSDTEHLVECARIAEDVGFDGIAMSDHLFFPAELRSSYPYVDDGQPYWEPETHWPDVWVSIGAMAAVTSRLKFCTYVYVLPARHPLLVAKAAGTAAVLSGGRVILGVGAGWMREEYDQLGEDFDTRGPRLEEMVEVLRTVWRGGMAEHHGKFYDVAPLQMSPAPGTVPVYVGGETNVAIRRAARLADGWAGINMDWDRLDELLARLARERKEAGREGEPFEIMAAVNDLPTPANVERLEDAGVTQLVTSAFFLTAADTSTMDGKRRALEEFGETYLAPLRQRPGTR